MLRAGAIALLAMLFIAANPIQASPVPKPANIGKPRTPEQRAPQPQQDTGQSKRAASPAPGSAVTAPLYVKPNCEHGCGYSEVRENWWERLWTDPVATFTAVLALFTLIMAVATVRLWDATAGLRSETKRLAEDSKKQLIKVGESIAAATANAAATQNAAAAMEEVATETEMARLSAELRTQRQLRAYVGVVGAQVEIKGVGVEVRLKLRNAGQTPAYGMRGKGKIKFANAFDPKWLDETEFFAQGTYMPPNAKFDYKIVGKAEELMSGIQPDPAKAMFVFGRLEYLDIDSEKRWTNFRFTIAWIGDGRMGGLMPCEEGNDAN